MSMTHCGKCKPNQYLCPSDQKTCVASAADYGACPGIKGTHLDSTLPAEQRIDYILQHTNLTTQIMQMQNSAPEARDL
jgi:hypothetical protein